MLSSAAFFNFCTLDWFYIQYNIITVDWKISVNSFAVERHDFWLVMIGYNNTQEVIMQLLLYQS